MFQRELFGQRLAEIRKKNSDTQDQLGAVIGVGKTMISQVEHGDASTSVERLTLICEHYHVSADYLLGFTDDPAPHGWKVPDDAP